MSDKDQDAPKRPSHIAYTVRENEDGKAFFNRVGSAFAHKDGKGHDVVLDATPVNGRITLRTPKERLDDMRGQKDGAKDRDAQDKER